jgi:UDP-N-acetylglucosamine acyltransferase
MSIHPSAVVEKGAKLGADVVVGPFAFVDRDTEIGDRCVIGPHAVIHAHTRIGAGSRVHAGAVLGDIPQDVAFKPGTISRVEIGANCTIREGVTIHRGTKPDTATVTGDGCFLMANSHLGHNVKLGQGVILANGALLAGYVEVGDRAFISGNAAIHQFVHIGRLAMTSGCSVITKDLPPFCTARGASLNHVAGLNVVGMRRAGMSPQDRQAVRLAFKVLYRSGLNVSQAVDRLRRDFPDGPAREFREFVEGSKRGICAFGGSGEDIPDEE